MCFFWCGGKRVLVALIKLKENREFLEAVTRERGHEKRATYAVKWGEKHSCTLAEKQLPNSKKDLHLLWSTIIREFSLSV